MVIQNELISLMAKKVPARPISPHSCNSFEEKPHFPFKNINLIVFPGMGNVNSVQTGLGCQPCDSSGLFGATTVIMA